MTQEQSVYKVIKFTNGEDVISEVWGLDDTSNDVIFLGDPYIVKVFPMQSTNQTSQTIALTKWNPYTSDERIPVSMRYVMSVANVKSDLLNYYINVSEQMRSDDEEFIDEVVEDDEPFPQEEEELTKEYLMDILMSKKSILH